MDDPGNQEALAQEILIMTVYRQGVPLLIFPHGISSWRKQRETGLGKPPLRALLLLQFLPHMGHQA